VFLELYSKDRLLEEQAVLLQLRVEERERAQLQLSRQAQELEQLNAELARSNRDLEHFASMAAHDLHQPLTTVAGFLQTLEHIHGPQLDPGARELMSAALRGTARLETIITDLLAFAMVATAPPAFELVACTEVVDEVLESLGQAVKEADATVSMGALPTVRGDRGLLAQLFQNLLSNALKFTRSEVRPAINVDAQLQGTGWCFSVTDNGLGVPARQRERIFEPFARGQAGSARPGTGIGLAVCKRVVERHGGRIWVDVPRGGGSSFRFTIAADNEGDAASG
jgi:signal transduction histidine kinase